MTRLRRPLVLLFALLASGGLTACGNHKDEQARVVRAENEGLYLTIGELKYQVQVSRQLNPADTQDRNYLFGIPQDQRELATDEVWFGVFMRVQNETDEPLQPSGAIEVVDTQENAFKPIALDETNLFAYRSTVPILGGHVLPDLDTPAFDSPVQGALLLFKLKLTSLDNRPLELKIEGSQPPAQTGIFDLDV